MKCDIFDEKSDREKYFHLFDTKLSPFIYISQLILRSETEYDDDPFRKETALGYYRTICEGRSQNKYLVIAGQDVLEISQFRSKKGILWGNEMRKKLPHLFIEKSSKKNKSRLGIVFNLQSFAFNQFHDYILNSIYTILVLSPLNEREFATLAEDWLSNSESSSEPFDMDKIQQDIINNNASAVVIYKVADNGNPETIGIMSNSKNIIDQISRLLGPQRE